MRRLSVMGTPFTGSNIVACSTASSRTRDVTSELSYSPRGSGSLFQGYHLRPILPVGGGVYEPSHDVRSLARLLAILAFSRSDKSNYSSVLAAARLFAALTSLSITRLYSLTLRPLGWSKPGKILPLWNLVGET